MVVSSLELHEAVKKLENDKLQLKSELEHSKLECDHLRASLHSATSEQVELQKQNDLFQQQVNSSEVQSRSHHVRQLEREVESLQRKLEGVIDDADHREIGECSESKGQQVNNQDTCCFCISPLRKNL